MAVTYACPIAMALNLPVTIGFCGAFLGAEACVACLVRVRVVAFTRPAVACKNCKNIGRQGSSALNCLRIRSLFVPWTVQC